MTNHDALRDEFRVKCATSKISGGFSVKDNVTHEWSLDEELVADWWIAKLDEQSEQHRKDMNGLMDAYESETTQLIEEFHNRRLGELEAIAKQCSLPDRPVWVASGLKVNDYAEGYKAGRVDAAAIIREAKGKTL